jgi:hypothetical protein
MAFNGLLMSRTYLVFGDIDGKLDMLRVECTRCGPKGGAIEIPSVVT